MASASLHICVPVYGCKLHLECLAALMQLRHAAARRGLPTTIRMVGNESLITRARNIMVAEFLKSEGGTHLLFVDSDIVFNPDDIFEMMDADKDVVCGIYAKKAIQWDRIDAPEFAHEPVIQRGIDFNINLDVKNAAFQGKFCKVLDAATGLMLIKRTAIEKLYTDHSYLNCVNDMPGSQHQTQTYCAIFDCMIDPDTRRYLSEDYAFCRRVQWSGLEVWAMMTCVTGHVGAMHLDASNPRMLENLARRFGGGSATTDVHVASTDDIRRLFERERDARERP